MWLLLEDINFFFKEAKFEFTIDKIDQGTTSENHNFIKFHCIETLAARPRMAKL